MTLTSANPSNLEQNFGYAPSNGEITGTVFNDLNGNGTQDSGEPGIAGVTVTVTDTLTNNSLTMTTSSTGTFDFTNLIAGNYNVVVTTGTGTPLEGFVNTYSPDGNFDSKSTVAFSGPSNMTSSPQNFGYEKATASATSILSGVVYVDANNNGIVDSNEIGIPNVTITLQQLTNGSYSTVATTTTNSSGFYEFKSLAAGTYQIVETHPSPPISTERTRPALSGEQQAMIRSRTSLSRPIK